MTAMTFPWSQPQDDSTKYSSLEQDEMRDSEAGSSGYIPSVQGAWYAQKKFFTLLIANVAILALLLVTYYGECRNAAPARLLDSPIPQFPREIRTFKLDPLYLSLPSDESNAAWERLHGPNGRGFVRLESDNGFDFPDTKAGLSVFHQLHCLGAVRKFIWDLVYQREDPQRLLREWPENVTAPSYHAAIHGLWHISHCLDYLRQGIQCSGDVSLEFVSKNTGLAVVDGLDYPHECKTWDAIWDYAEEYA